MIIKSRKMSVALSFALVVAVTSLIGTSVNATHSNQESFFDSVKARCGDAFSGSVEDSSNSTA